MQTNDLQLALQHLLKAEIIAYPTEGVYGLGCDPLNEKAVKNLLALKKRPIDKGLILIAASWEQLENYILPIESERMAIIQQTPHTTWLFPKTDFVPYWISGNHDSIAVRVTEHPLAKALCETFGRPIVSTSANISNQDPARNAEEVEDIFLDKVSYILRGPLGTLGKPSSIRDAISNKIIRD